MTSTISTTPGEWELTIPIRHLPNALVMLHAEIDGSRDAARSPLDDEDAAFWAVVIDEDERRLHRLVADGVLVGTREKLHELLTYQVREGGDDEWWDAGEVAWKRCCVDLVERWLIAGPPVVTT